MEQISITCARKLCVCASEKLKLISTLDGRFPDMGHHLENEMGGLWMYPVKLLDGFWMHIQDHNDTACCWLSADGYTAHPWGNTFHYRQGMGHTTVQVDLHQIATESASGIILQYDLYNAGKEKRQITLDFLARTDLRPAWSARFLGAPNSGQDSVRYLPEQAAFHAVTEGHPWHVMFGCGTPPDRTDSGELFGPEITSGLGISGKLSFDLTLEAEEKRTLSFFIAGSAQSFEECAEQYRMLSSESDRLMQEKRHRMEKIAQRACLNVDDQAFADAYTWVKYNTDWLVLNAPAGRGIAAGLPEYAWWFGCDSCYTIQGLLCMGDAALCRDTLRLLLKISREQCADGRIVHEIVSDGSVYHYGNTQETAHFIDALWIYYQWTGDTKILREALPYLDKSVQWLLAQDDDGDLFPSGYGIIEIAGLNLELIDSAVYTARAFHAYAAIRWVLGIRDDLGRQFEALSARIIEKINTELWDEQEGLYCDAFACGQDVKKKLDSILRSVPQHRRPQARAQLEQKLKEKPSNQETGWVLNKNWVINTPMEVEIAPRDKADRALRRMHTGEFIGPWGMYLSGLSQKEIMTVNTGVMAAAQVRYGYADRALELLQRMLQTFGMGTPGCISEMCPDYGCTVQAWTAYAMFVPVVTGFFGVDPQAEKGEIYLRPCMPQAWKTARLDSLPVLDGSLTLAYQRQDNRQIMEIENNTNYPIRMLCGTAELLGSGKHRIEWIDNFEKHPQGVDSNDAL